MVRIPLDSVHGKVVVLVGFKIQLLARLGAQVDLTLFSTNEEEIRLVFIEVEAHTSSKTVDEWLLLAVGKLLLLINDKLELDDLLRLELVLHQVPQSDATIGRNGVEAQGLTLDIGVPTNLPDGVSVLVSPDS